MVCRFQMLTVGLYLHRVVCVLVNCLDELLVGGLLHVDCLVCLIVDFDCGLVDNSCGV